MISRLMLNIQNPALFGTHRSQTGTGYTTDCNIGPFVATRGSTDRRRRFTSVVFSSVPESFGSTATTSTGSAVASMAKKPTWHQEARSTFSDSQRTWTTDTSTGAFPLWTSFFCIASLIQPCLTSCVLDIELNELSSGSDRGGIR